MRAWLASKGVHRKEPEFELRDALAQPGCAICRLAARTAARQLDIISYESVNDIELRAKLRESRGFCRKHFWQFLEETRDPLGTALVAKDVINTLATMIELPGLKRGITAAIQDLVIGRRRRSTTSSLSSEWLAPTRRCVICVAAEETELTYLELLVGRLTEPTFAAAWNTSEALCWPHLARTLQLSPSEAALDLLLDRSAAVLGVLGAGPIDDANAAARLLGATHGYFVAERRLLLPELLADPLRRKLEEVVRPDGPAKPACVVCRNLAEREPIEVKTGLDQDIGALCPHHAWRLLVGRGEAAAARLAALCQTRRETLAKLATRSSESADRGADRRVRVLALAAESRTEARCPECSRDASAAEAEVSRLAGDVLTGGGTGGGYCLEHLLAMLRFADKRARKLILGEEVLALRGLSAELAEFIRKHDYRFLAEERGTERGSPWRAVELLAGPRWFRDG